MVKLDGQFEILIHTIALSPDNSMGKDFVITVIPNWNLKEDLRDCLQSLFEGIDSDQEIVVVDNGSTDGSIEMVQADFPQVTQLLLGENLGYAAALNAGFRYALKRGAKYILGLNNDTVIPAGAVRCLAERAARYPALGLVTPKVVYFDEPERLFSLGARRYRWLPLPVEFGNRWHDTPNYDHLIYYDYVTGCAMLMPAAVLRQVGLMNTAYFMNYEDNDLCRRIRDAGWQIGMDGGVCIFHKAYLSTSRNPYESIRRQARNAVWFYRRYPHGPAPWMTYSTLTILAYLKAGYYFLAGKHLHAKALLDGFGEGWRNPLPQLTGINIEENRPALLSE